MLAFAEWCRAQSPDAAIVMGDRLYGLIQNTADAVLTYYGGWFDRDQDPQTGVIGRQYFVCAEDFGSPASNPNNPIFIADRH